MGGAFKIRPGVALTAGGAIPGGIAPTLIGAVLIGLGAGPVGTLGHIPYFVYLHPTLRSRSDPPRQWPPGRGGEQVRYIPHGNVPSDNATKPPPTVQGPEITKKKKKEKEPQEKTLQVPSWRLPTNRRGKRETWVAHYSTPAKPPASAQA